MKYDNFINYVSIVSSILTLALSFLSEGIFKNENIEPWIAILIMFLLITIVYVAFIFIVTLIKKLWMRIYGVKTDVNIDIAVEKCKNHVDFIKIKMKELNSEEYSTAEEKALLCCEINMAVKKVNAIIGAIKLDDASKTIKFKNNYLDYIECVGKYVDTVKDKISK